MAFFTQSFPGESPKLLDVSIVCSLSLLRSLTFALCDSEQVTWKFLLFYLKDPGNCINPFKKVKVKSLSRVRLFATPWTVAYRLLRPWNSPSKNTGVSCHFLLQGIFPTQGSNQGLPHCRWILPIPQACSTLTSPKPLICFLASLPC